MTHLEALLRLWRDASELTTVCDHVVHLTNQLTHQKKLTADYRERLTRAEIIAHTQAQHIANLQHELEELR